jgi:hypothetical protein
MNTYSKWVLLAKKSAARNFLGQYFSSQAGDFASPNIWQNADAGQ